MKDAKKNLGQVITKNDVISIVVKYGYRKDIKNYEVKNASDGAALGFLADYWKLRVYFAANDQEKVLRFFIKNLPETNEVKASMVKDIGVHERELAYYKFVNSDLQVPKLKPWSPKFVTILGNALVMEDLGALQYTMRDKYDQFDNEHTLQALSTLARFHASTIIYEEKWSKEQLRSYRITEDYDQYLDSLLFSRNTAWFLQCKKGALEAVKALSKYSQDEETLRIIEDRWDVVWNDALDLPGSSEQRCVLSHRDLWNNNILFHYKKLGDNTLIPDDCVLVDFQMVSYQPPAADVMLLLNGNVDRENRKKNVTMFLNYYYNELESCLSDNDIDIRSILTADNFHMSVKKCNQWAIIAFACLAPLIFVEDSIISVMVGDSEQFNNMMFKDRGNYIKAMMVQSDHYRKFVMGIFEEIVDEYILK